MTSVVVSSSQSDLLAMQHLLSAALSPDNTLRNNAEHSIHSHLSHHPGPFTNTLCDVLQHSSTDDHIRSLIAIILRKKLPTGEPLLYESLTEDESTLQMLQQKIKNILIQQLLSTQTTPYLQRQIADTIAELALVLMYKDEWRELIPNLITLISQAQQQNTIPSSNPTSTTTPYSVRQQVLALTIIGKLAETIDSIQQYLPMITPVLFSIIEANKQQLSINPSVLTTAIDTYCHVLTVLDDEALIHQYSQLLDSILLILQNFIIQQVDESVMITLLETLVETFTVEEEGAGIASLLRGRMERWSMVMMMLITVGTPMFHTPLLTIQNKAFTPFKALHTFLTHHHSHSPRHHHHGQNNHHSTTTTTIPPALSASSTLLHEDIRLYCMELLVSVAQDEPGIIRRSETIIQCTVLSAFSLMLSVDNVDLHTWLQQQQDEEEEVFEAGQFSLRRFSEAIQGTKLTPIILTLFKNIMHQPASTTGSTTTASSSSSSPWQYRHAILRGLSEVAEVIPFEELPLTSIIQELHHPYPRVRYAAVECIGQIANDFAPHFQETTHAVLMQEILPLLCDAKYPRIQSHATFSLLKICEGLSEETMTLYTHRLLPMLIDLLRESVATVQEQVMPTIAAIAVTAPAAFEPFYTQVVPLFMLVIQNALGKEQVMLRARAMEAVTQVGVGMKREIFRSDAQKLMQMFLSIMTQQQQQQQQQQSQSQQQQTEKAVVAIGRNGLAEDDVSEQFMLQAWMRIATVLGDEFQPMLPLLLPGVFQAAEQSIGVLIRHSIQYLDQIEGTNQEDATTTASSIANTTAINTADSQLLSADPTDSDTEEEYNREQASLEDKELAMAMLVSFCHDLPNAFWDYVEHTARIALSELSCVRSPSIRSYAISLIPLLIKSTIHAYQTQRCTFAQLQVFVHTMLHAGIQRCPEEQELETLTSLILAIRESIVLIKDINLATHIIDQTDLHTITNALITLLSTSQSRIVKREQRMEEQEEEEEGLDEDLMTQLENGIQAELQLHIQVADCLGTLMQTHTHAFLPIWQRTLPYIQPMLQSSATNLQRIAIFLFDDLIAYTQVEAYAQELFPVFVPFCITYASLYPSDHKLTAAGSNSSSGTTSSGGSGGTVEHKKKKRGNAPLRQACAYGLGICAIHCTPYLLPYVPASIAALSEVIHDHQIHYPHHPHSSLLSTPASSLTDIDNCISALGKILSHYPQHTLLHYTTHLQLWFEALPLHEDHEEGIAMYTLLLHICTASHPFHSTLFNPQQQAATTAAGGPHHQIQKNIRHLLYIISEVVNTGFLNNELNTQFLGLLANMKRSGLSIGPMIQELSMDHQQKIGNLWVSV